MLLHVLTYSSGRGVELKITGVFEQIHNRFFSVLMRFNIWKQHLFRNFKEFFQKLFLHNATETTSDLRQNWGNKDITSIDYGMNSLEKSKIHFEEILHDLVARVMYEYSHAFCANSHAWKILFDQNTNLEIVGTLQPRPSNKLLWTAHGLLI